ncbi:MAG: RdgB/HAM1 family non-canonical purine NTP pyrophosphatase [Zoogloeaceae bacterium]|jgi:XTP/dITP diphosphohydrolase|nr:RdgB/HAM1 family non-canonical purine NTP pyrophosphatase [Zoogloeaceae bacterium]
MKELVLASGNPGKLRELTALLAPLGIRVIAQDALGVPEAEEPHATFLENALAKARHAARQTGLPTLADDSGLCVDILQGAPGVHSARYAGEPKSDARNNAKLLADLADTPHRRARFICVLVLTRHAEDPCPLFAEGQWQGEILLAPKGTGGFGYDPLFWDAHCQKSAAELDPATKNTRSHRGQAIQHLLKKLVLADGNCPSDNCQGK